MMTEIKIAVTGLDKLLAAFGRFPREITAAITQAGSDVASDVILPTQGIQNYPPLTDANRPPTPYYQRGLGTVYKSGYKATSENLGKQWVVNSSRLRTEIGNRASYAEYVHGDKQARAMERIGWRKLADIAQEKLSAIQSMYQAQVDAAIRRLGL